MGKTRLNTLKSSMAKNSFDYAGKTQEEIKNIAKDSGRYSQDELDNLAVALEQDRQTKKVFEDLEEQEKLKRKALESSKEIGIKENIGNIIEGVGDFFSGAFDSEVENFHMTNDGKLLKRRTDNQWSPKRNFSSNPFNSLAGINDDGSYNKDIWEEASPRELAEVVKRRAQKRVDSEAFNAGDATANFGNTVIKTGLADAISGVSGMFNNGLGVNIQGAKNLANTFNTSLIDMELSALDKVGLGNSDYYKRLSKSKEDNLVKLQQDAEKLKQLQDTRSKEIKDKGNNKFSEGLDAMFALQDNEERFKFQKNLRNLVTQQALELEGRNKQELLSEEDANVDTSLLEYNGAQYPKETLTDSGSKWDAKKLVLKQDGTPLLDNDGKPVYEDKYSLLDKFNNAKILDTTFDKYGSEEITDAVASSVGFLLGGKGLGSSVGTFSKGVSAAGKSLGRIGNISEKAFKILENTTSKLDDLILSKAGKTVSSGAMLTRGANAFNKAAQTSLTSYLMTNAESQGIGQDAAKTVYNTKIDKELNTDLNSITKKIAEENPQLDSSEIQLRAEMELNKLRSDFSKTNPERHADILAESLAAKEVAASLNNLNTVFNLNFGSAFTKGKSLSRSLIENPLSRKELGKKAYNVLGEGVQEYFEEGLFNNYAQKAAESNAEGKTVTLYDYFNNDFLTKENVTSGMIGLLSGMGQSFVTEGLSDISKYKENKKQQDQIKDMKKMLSADSSNLTSMFNMLHDSNALLEYNMQVEALTNEIKNLEKEGKVDQAEIKKGELQGLSESLFINKAVRAAATGTSGALEDILTEMSNNEEFTEEQRFNLKKAIELNNTVSNTFDKYSYFKGNGKIVENRINKQQIQNQLERYALENQKVIYDDYNSALNAETSRQFGKVDASSEESLSAFEQLSSRITLDPLTNKSAERKLQFDNFMEKGKEVLNKLETEFNYLTSRQGQKDLILKEKELLKKAAVEKATVENVEEAKQEIIQAVKDNTIEELIQPVAEAIKEVENKVHNEVVKTNEVKVPTWRSNVTLAEEKTPPVPSTTVSNTAQAVDTVDLNSLFAEEKTPEEKVSKIDVQDINSLFSSDNDTSSPLFSFVLKFDDKDDAHNQIVSKLTSALQKDLSSNPNIPLDGFIARLALDKGLYKVGQSFDLLMEAWGRATGEPLSTVERTKIYNSYFGVDNALNVFDSIIPKPTFVGNDLQVATPSKTADITPAIDVTPEGQQTKTEATPEVVEGVNTSKVDVEISQKLSETKIGNLLNAESNPKLAFLGLAYDISEDGQEYTTRDTKILDSAKKFLDYRNFKPGDNIDLTFNFNYLYNPDNPLRIWKEDPQDNLIKGYFVSVKDRVSLIFPGLTYEEFVSKLQSNPRELLENEEFLKMIPVGLIYEDEVVEGGINDYDWWNPRNVAPMVHPETNQPIPYSENIIIVEGQKKNLEVRQAILNSDNFSVNTTITSNDAHYTNKLLLETQEEKEQGYSNTFNSLFDAFDGDETYMQENTGFGFFANKNIVNTDSRGGQGRFVINGKEVLPEQIINLQSLMNSIKTSYEAKRKEGEEVIDNPESGRRVFLHKTGEENGKDIYTATLVVTNHKALQGTFNKLNSLLDVLMAPNLREGYKPSYAWILRNKKDTDLLNQQGITKEDIAIAEKLKKIFISKFNIDISNQDENIYFKNFYPVRNPNNPKDFTQNISTKNRENKNGIPDILEIVEKTLSTSEALDKILTGDISSISANSLYAKTQHTQYVYTPIEKNGEVIYSNLAQKKIQFSLNDEQSSTNSIDIINKTLEEAKSQLNFLKAGLKDSPTESIKESVKIAEEKVKVLEEKVKQEVESQKTTPVETVTTIEEVEETRDNFTSREYITREGVSILVEPKDIITKETEVGNIYYTKVNGDLIMLDSNIPVEEEVENSNSKKEFTDSDINDINNEVFFRALSLIDINDFNRQSIINKAHTVFSQITSELRDKNLNDEADFMENNKNEILGINSYDGSIKEIIDVTFDITPEISLEDVDSVDSENPSLHSENVKDYSKEGFEQDIKASLGMKVKAILSGIKDSRYTEKGFGGFDKTIPLNDVLDFLQQALAQSGNNTLESLIKTVNLKQQYNPKDFGFYTEIIERISRPELVDSGVTNEILYNLYQGQLQMDFLFYSINKDGSFSAQKYDANSKAPNIVKERKWLENFKVSPLVKKYEEGYYKIVQEEADKIFEIHNEIKESLKEGSNVDTFALERFFKAFGIELNEMTPIALLQDNFGVPGVNLTKEGIILSEKGVVNNLVKSLEKAIKLQNEGNRLTLSPSFVESRKDVFFNVLTNDNSRLGALVNFDNAVSAISMTSIYVGGKIVNSFTKPNLISNTTKKLKGNRYLPFNLDTETSEFVNNNLLKTPVTKDSIIAEMLQNDPNFKPYFDVVNISLEALKERGTQSRTDREITSLSDKDAFITMFNLFTSIEGEIKNESYSDEYSLKFRKGIISFPTLSDSSQSPLIKTALVDLNKNNFEDNSIEKLNYKTLEFVTKHLAYPSMRRMFNYYKATSDGSRINIDGHNVGAKFFTELPSLSFLPLKVEIEGREYTLGASEVFKTFADRHNSEEEAIQDFMNTYREEIHNEVQRNLDHEVGLYISKDGKSGSLVKDGIYTEETGLQFVDKAYKENPSKDPGSKLNQARLMMFDYVVNYMITQKEIQSIYAGDIANYFKDGMGKGLENNKNSFLVTENDVIKTYYNTPENKSRIKELKTQNDFETLSKEFPYLQGVVELFPEFNSFQRTALNLPLQSHKFKGVIEKVQNNLSKRLKAILSPGSQLPDSFNVSKQYLQVMVKDVDSISEAIISLANLKYPGLAKDTEFLKRVKIFKAIDEKYEDQRTDREKSFYKDTLKQIKNKYPQIESFFVNKVTDAQEYTSWKENLNQLRLQGRLTNEQFENFKTKLASQSKQGVNDSNRFSQKEMQDLVMQTTKPLHAGLYYREHNGYNYQQFVYVKSSSFPLIPQLTESFPKLEALRKNVERMETENIPVRVSYESANKVGSVLEGGVSLSKLFNENISDQELQTIQSASALLLDRANFSIQQDKPFKSDKNAKVGKNDRINRATQFEKIILGDGVSKETRKIFPNKFSQDILDALDITPTDNKISGVELQKVYNELYKREQKLLKDKLYRELGIERSSDMFNGNPKAMEKLVKLLNKRLNNKQDRKALELIYIGLDENNNAKKGTKEELISSGFGNLVKAEFKLPIWMTPNSRKFESVLNSVINKGLINLKLPGFSSPVASQQGFDIKGFDKGTKYKNLITTPNFNPEVGLTATVDGDGKLTHAQVFMASKFKILNKDTNQYEYVDLTKFVDENNILDTTRIPEELLQLFSFRIPTSAHQSGVTIEIAGFLPHSVGDMLVVPKDHATQIGEDFDIDVRYMYQLNYDVDSKGNLKVLDFDDLVLPKTPEEIKQEYTSFKEDLFKEFFNTSVDNSTGKVNKRINNNYWKSNQDKLWEIHFLETALAENEIAPEFLRNINTLFNANFSEELFEDEDTTLDSQNIRERIEELKSELIPKDIVKSRSEDLFNEYLSVSKDLQKAFYKERAQAFKLANNMALAIDKEKHDLKVVENNIVNVYKSVFDTPDKKVRNLINTVLSTDFAENTVNEMDNKKNQEASDIHNIFSPSVQRDIMKLGAAGKMGIGVHSNAVTMNSILQQSTLDLHFFEYIETEQGSEKIPVNIQLGTLVFDGKLGLLEKNGRRISASGMESQNSSTDNQKLQIMGRRNENRHTINTLVMLQATGNDFDGTVINGNEMSYGSLFIDQPILRDYVSLMEDINSSTSTDKFMTSEEVRDFLFNKWGRGIPQHLLRKDDNGNITTYFTTDAKKELSVQLTGETLYNSLLERDADSSLQWYVLDSFLKLKGYAVNYSRLQRIINVENGGLGISYFDTISMMEELQNLFNDEIAIENSRKILGDTQLISEIGTAVVLLSNGETVQVNYEERDGEKVFASGEADVYEYIQNRFETEEISDIRYIITPEDKVKKDNKVKELESMGYIRVQLNGQNSYYMVKPENHYAHKIVNSITTGYELWNSIFPYDHATISSVLADIVANSKNLNGEELKDLKYKAISDMKDYVYSNALDLFDGNSDAYRKSLFFDTETNESLATYMLKLSNNPLYKNKMFNQNFFKDLVFEINSDTYPSLIKYNTSDVSKSYNLSIYNIFEKLINSKVALPDYNGKPYNQELLMKDLLRYSLLADQGNGAIGFRQFLPMSLFDKYNVSERVKQQTDVNNSVIQTLVFNGVQNAVKKFFGSSLETGKVVKNTNNISFDKISSFVNQVNAKYKRDYNIDNVISLVNSLGDVRFNISEEEVSRSSFVKQFLQHNPNLIRNLGSVKSGEFGSYATGKIKEILPANGFSNNTNISRIAELHIDSKIFGGNYFTIKDSSNKFIIFENKGNGIYKPIPTLGVFGLNEYSVGENLDKSLINKNNATKDLEGNIIPEATFKYLQNSSLQNVIQDFIDSGSPYQAAFQFLSPYVNLEDMKIQIVNNSSDIYYDRGNIYMGDRFLTADMTKKQVQEKVLEELIHKLTVENLNKYLEVTGINADGTLEIEYKNEEIPDEIKTLLETYQEAVDYLVNKYGVQDVILASQQNTNVLTITGDNRQEAIDKATSLYRIKNFHEFIAGMFLRDEPLSKELSTVKSKTGLSLLGDYATKVMRMIYSVANVFKTKRTSVNSTAISSFYSFLEKYAEKPTSKPKNLVDLQNTNTLDNALEILNEDPTSFSQNNIEVTPTSNQDFTDKIDTVSISDLFEKTEGDPSLTVEEEVINLNNLFNSEESIPAILPTTPKENIKETKEVEVGEPKIYNKFKAVVAVDSRDNSKTVTELTEMKIPGFNSRFGIVVNDNVVHVFNDSLEKENGVEFKFWFKLARENASDMFGNKISKFLKEGIKNNPNSKNLKRAVLGYNNLSNFENINLC